MSVCTQARAAGRRDNERMRSTHLRRFPPFAAVAAGLALLLAGCGALKASRPGNSGGRPVSGRDVIYVVDQPHLVPIDLAHRTTGQPITFPGDGSGPVAVTPDHRHAYLLTGASVVPVSLTTGASGQPVAVPAGSTSIAIGTDSRTAYLTDGIAITSVDLRTGSAGRRFVLPAFAADATGFPTTGPFLVAASAPVACVTGAVNTADGRSGPPVIECVDFAAGVIGQPITLSGFPLAAVLAPDGRTAYIGSGNLLVPVDLVTGRTGRPIKLPMLGIGAIAITADGRTAYAGNLKPVQPHSGVVVPVDLVTGTAQTAISVPSYPFSITDIVLARDGRTAYAAANSSVIPIDLTTRKAARPIPMPADVHGIALAG